jgi:hypothetical protein
MDSILDNTHLILEGFLVSGACCGTGAWLVVKVGWQLHSLSQLISLV